MTKIVSSRIWYAIQFKVLFDLSVCRVYESMFLLVVAHCQDFQILCFNFNEYGWFKLFCELKHGILAYTSSRIEKQIMAICVPGHEKTYGCFKQMIEA